jgi:hypothetical protein
VVVWRLKGTRTGRDGRGKVSRSDRVRVPVAAVKRQRGADYLPIRGKRNIEPVDNGARGRIRSVRVWNNGAEFIGRRVAAPYGRAPLRTAGIGRAAVFDNGAGYVSLWRMHRKVWCCGVVVVWRLINPQ